MNSQIEQTISDYYTSKIKEHGPCAHGVDWESETNQLLRLEALLRAGPYESLLDYGCGYGKLLDVVDSKAGLLSDTLWESYQGYDISHEMICQAQREHPYALSCFTEHRCFVRKADWVVASGIFNVKLDFGAADWSMYISETLQDMWGLCNVGVAFNMLSLVSRQRQNFKLHYADPGNVLNWCLDHLSSRATLDHDVVPSEFTMHVWH